MNHHLNDDEISRHLVEPDAGVQTHLSDCPECSARISLLERSLAEYGVFARQAGEHRNIYWWKQRATSLPGGFPVLRYALAAVLTFSVVASVPFFRTTNDVKNPPPALKPISDEALLSEVQNDVGREYPDALAPVQTNADSAVAQAPASHKKEHRK